MQLHKLEKLINAKNRDTLMDSILESMFGCFLMIISVFGVFSGQIFLTKRIEITLNFKVVLRGFIKTKTKRIIN